jgi:DNA-binding transcriptional ArsR family regulator
MSMENKDEAQPLVNDYASNGLSSSPPERASLSGGLSPIQEEMMVIAYRLMERHYVLDTDALYKECKHVMKSSSPATIRSALQDLLRRKLLIHGKAVTREQLLVNANRQRILDLVKGEPGIHFSRVRELMQKEPRTIQWHLEMLVKFDFIREERYGNNVVYFDFILGKKDDLIYYYLHKDGAPEIFKHVLASPGISSQMLMDALHMPRSTFTRKVRVLLEQGFLIGNMQPDKMLSLHVKEECVPILQACFASGMFS